MRSPDPEFEVLFSAEYASLVRGLSVAAGSVDEAADAVQDAFVQLHRHWRRVRRYQDPTAWVRRVAVNRVANQHRSRRCRDTAVADLGRRLVLEQGPSPERLVLHQAVAALPVGQRLAIGLHYLADLPIVEVAELMGVSQGTVKSQLHDARQRLATTLEVVDD